MAICPSTLGTVIDDVRPSWFTAAPRMTAYTRSPSASAAASGFRNAIAAPSPRT
jgi:hypothetical protein